MTFVTASALLVALFVVAPIAAHLLRRKQAEEKPFPPARLVPATQPAARRRSHLEDRALFVIRALAVLGLAALGATPFVHCSRLALNRHSGASVALALVVDDSLSMRAKLPGGATRFDRSLKAARDLVGEMGTGDAVAIVLAGAPARVALASTTNMTAVAGALDALAPSDRATDLDGALHLASGLLRGMAQADKRIVVLSDLADGSPDAPPLAAEGEVSLWAPLEELEASGDDCAVTRADRAGSKVWARVICAASNATSDAGAAPNRSLELRAGANVLAKVALPAMTPGHVESIGLDVPANASEVLRVALTGEDAIAEDDSAPVVAAGGTLPMAVIVDSASSRVATGGPPPIEQALSALDLDAQIHPLPSVPEHAEELATFAAIVVDDPLGFTPEVRRAISAWVQKGGVLLLTLGPRAAAAPLGAGFDPLVPGVVRWGASPSPGVDPASAPSLGPSASGLANLDPRGRLTLDAAALEDAEIDAKWLDGAPFLVRRSVGRGAVLIATLPLSIDESDLVLRPAFLSLLERFVEAARARGGARRIDVGEAWTFDGYKDVTVARVSDASAGKSTPLPIVDADGRLRAAPSLAGLYELHLDGEASTRVAAIPEREIDLRRRKIKEDARSTSLGGTAASLDVSPYVAIALLALMAIELLLRTFSGKVEATT